MKRAISWLQLSDIHLRTTDAYNQRVVLDSLLDDIRDRITKDDLAFDLIFLTGDIAFSGGPQEYDVAEAFVRRLAIACDVSLDAIYCVPGNHDVERSQIIAPARALSSRDNVSQVL